MKLAEAEALQSRRLQEPLLNTSCAPTNTPQSTERRDTTAEARQARLNSKRGKRLSIKKTAKNVWVCLCRICSICDPKSSAELKKVAGSCVERLKAGDEGAVRRRIISSFNPMVC